MITEEHRRALKLASGISSSTIELAELVSCSSEKSLELVGSSREGIAFPYYDLDGKILGHRLKLETPLPDGGKYLQKKETHLHLFFLKKDLESLKNREILFITEGEKKALALREILPEETAVTSIPGCWNWGIKGELGEIFHKIPLSRKITLIPDGDYFSNTNVKNGYNAFIKKLIEKGSKVSLIDIRIPETPKLGVDDFLLKKGPEALLERIKNPFWQFEDPENLGELLKTAKDVREQIRKAVLLDPINLGRLLKAISKETKDGLSYLKKEHLNAVMQFARETSSDAGIVCIWNQVEEKTSKIYKYIAKALHKNKNFFICPVTDELLFVRKNKLIRITEGRHLSRILANKIDFFHDTNSSGGFKTIPEKYCGAFLEEIRSYVKLRPLTKLAKAPMYVGGQLIFSPGYYEDAAILYVGEKVEPKYTFERLQEISSYFPVKSLVDKTHLIAALIAPVFNQSFPGNHPFFLIQGNDVNLGKSSLARICGILHTAEDAGDISFSHDEQEFEKQIVSQILTSDFFLIDNVAANSSRGTIRSACLERTISSPKPSYRRLGSNTVISKENTFTIFVTLNQGSFSKDLITRALTIFLSDDNREVMPKNFNPRQYAYKHRDELLREIVGLVLSWMKSGSKKIPVRYPKFPEWGATLNGILHEYGVKNFLSNYSDTEVKLDALSSGLLELAQSEFENRGVSKTETRSVQEWRILLENICKQDDFSSSKPIGKTIEVSKRIRGMLNRQYDLVVSENPRIVELKSQKGPGGGTNTVYFFSLVREESVEKDPHIQTTITVTPDDSWMEPQKGDEQFHYEFRGETFPSLWWKGENLSGKRFSFDIETEKDNHSSIILASAFDGKTVFRLAPENLQRFFETNKDKEWICHNSSFDLYNLSLFLGRKENCIDLVDAGLVKDSLALSRLYNLATTGTPVGGNKLGELSEKHLGVTLPKDVLFEGEKVSLSYEKFCGRIHEAPACFVHYNAFDVIATWFLWDRLEKLAIEVSLKNSVDPSKLLSHDNLVRTSFATTLTSHYGMEVDQDRVANLKEELTRKIESSLCVLREYGYDPIELRKKTPKKGEKTITQIFDDILERVESEGHKLVKKYHGGRKKEVFSSKADDLESVHHPFIQAYLGFTKNSKALETYVKHYEGLTRVHTTYDPCLATGRTSSRKPNLQNLPRSGGIREIFRAGENKKFVIVDYSSAELFAGCQYALTEYGFSRMSELLIKGVDVHKYISAKFLGIPEDEVTKEQRQYGKLVNFGRIGASGAAVLQKKLLVDYGTDLSIDEIKKLIVVWETEFSEFKRHFEAANKANLKALDATSSQAYKIKKAAQGEPLTELEEDEAWEKIKLLKQKHPKLDKFSGDIDRRKPSDELAFALDSLRVATVNSGRIAGGRKHTEWCNHAIQASQADVTNYAWWLLVRAGYKVVNCIHDEFIVECDEEKAEEPYEKVTEILKLASKEFFPDMWKYMGSEGAITDRWEKI